MNSEDVVDRFLVDNGLKSLLMVVMDRCHMTRSQALEWFRHAQQINELVERLYPGMTIESALKVGALSTDGLEFGP